MIQLHRNVSNSQVYLNDEFDLWPVYSGERFRAFRPSCILLLLCSHSPNDVPLEPQRNVSIAVVWGAMCPSNHCILVDSSTVICWMRPVVILGVSGLFCYFHSIFDGKSC